LRILDCKNPRCREIVHKSAPILDPYLCSECASHKKTFEEGVEFLGVPAERDPYLVRGLDYYTRTVFEFQTPEIEGQSTFLAGGRYDELFSLFTMKKIPAIGFALGIERALLLSRKEIQPPPALTILWIPLGSVGKGEVLKFLKVLRQEGWFARAIFHKRSLKSALRYADKLKARFVILDGEEERKEGGIKIRDMKDHTEHRIERTPSAIIAHLRSLHAL
jgi:histidyl-tRNA synthetase